MSNKAAQTNRLPVPSSSFSGYFNGWLRFDASPPVAGGWPMALGEKDPVSVIGKYSLFCEIRHNRVHLGFWKLLVD